MSDLRLFNFKQKKIIKKIRPSKHDLRNYLENSIEDILGITIISKDLKLFNGLEAVEVLGYDENYQLVIIEYRSGRFSNTINKGLILIDHINKNTSIIKTQLNEKLGYELSNTININPRLIVVGDDFNKYDEHAIKQMPYTVDLIKYQAYSYNLIVFEKLYQSQAKSVLKNSYTFKNDVELNLYKAVSEYILSLGDEVSEVIVDNFIAYRKISNFIYLVFEDGVELKLKKAKFKTIKLKTMRDFERAQAEIELCYDEN